MTDTAVFDSLVAYDDDFTDGWRAPDSVLLQHGFSRNGLLWRGWVPHLGRMCRVIRPDLPGCGRTPDPGPDFVHTMADLVGRTRRLLDSLEIERVHYVGEGLGGAIGAALAIAEPDRVRSLTLIGEPVRLDASIAKNHATGFESWQQAMTTLGMREWWLRARASGNDLTGDAAIDGYLADQVATTPVHVAVALSRWATSWDFRDLLPQVQAPVLLIWSEGGKFVDAAGRDALTALAPHGRQLLIKGVTSQMVTFTHPDLVAPHVAEFVGDHAQRPSG